ncbi:hypothetical protein N0M98_15435 [Paenibacillus doosanensis]|nr:hypothetical protein [Paenibacillus doosanensis]
MYASTPERDRSGVFLFGFIRRASEAGEGAAIGPQSAGASQLGGIAYASKGDLESGIVARADVIGGGPKRKITDNLTSDE